MSNAHHSNAARKPVRAEVQVKNLAFLVLPFLLTGCVATSITAVHDPLYRPVAHTSSITATASSPDNVARISIFVTTGAMINCSAIGLPRSIIPCRTTANRATHVCNFPASPPNATCTFSQALGNNAIVSYRAEVVNGKGRSETTDEITYSGGMPTDPSVARPIWWRRDAGMPVKIDLGFFPDTDYGGNYTMFGDDANAIARGAFFNNTDGFANYFTTWKSVFNLWAAPDGADAEGCRRTFPAAFGEYLAVMDGQAILHRNAFRDCAALGPRGAGSVEATAGDPSWVLTHEAGHFIFAQADEYCCDGGYTPGSCANVFPDQAACLAAPATGGNCVMIGNPGGHWRRAPATAFETMSDRRLDSNWQDHSLRCVGTVIGNCLGSSTCF